MRSERFDFSNTTGEKLAAVLNMPLAAPKAFALFAHCFIAARMSAPRAISPSG
jgi:hypothetical protein